MYVVVVVVYVCSDSRCMYTCSGSGGSSDSSSSSIHDAYGLFYMMQ